MSKTPGGNTCNLRWGNRKGDIIDVAFGKTTWLCQTFAVPDTSVIWRGFFRFWAFFGLKTYFFYIFATDANGTPTGLPIYDTYLLPWKETYTAPGKWHNFEFDTMPVLEPGIYALAIASPYSVTVLSHRLRARSPDLEYNAGKAFISTDSGNTWDWLPHIEFPFEIWGWTPPPLPPPTPSTSNWTPTNFVITSVLDGFTIVVTTDIPCHLYLRWTDNPPHKHPYSRLQRGILMMTDVYYCFTTFHENEQLEEGDTYVHTFVKKNWPVCQTRYIYFIGTVQGAEQPSTSAIFTVHRTEEEIHTSTGPIPCTTDNRTLWYEHANWAGAHDRLLGKMGDWHNWANHFLIARARHTVSRNIMRSYLFFPTSTIPDDSVIKAAYLDLFVIHKENLLVTPHRKIQVTKGVQTKPIIYSDYGAQLPHTFVGGERWIDELILDQYNRFTLNDIGLAFIKPGGMTRLCIRQEHDVLDLDLTFGTLDIWYHSREMGIDFAPKLTVEFVPGDPPHIQWAFYEPWSSFLSENNAWGIFPLEAEADVEFPDGYILLRNFNHEALICYTWEADINLPLEDMYGRHLRVKLHSTDPVYHPERGILAYSFFIANGVDNYVLEPIIAHGTDWGPWGQYESFVTSKGAWDMGPGVHYIDLYDMFYYAKKMAGCNINPSNWRIKRFQAVNEQNPPAVYQEYKFHEIGFYYN